MAKKQRMDWLAERPEIKKRIQEKMADGTDGDKEWDELLEKLDRLAPSGPDDKNPDVKTKAAAARERAAEKSAASEPAKRGRPKKPDAKPRPETPSSALEDQLSRAEDIDTQRVARGDKSVEPKGEAPYKADKGETQAKAAEARKRANSKPKPAATPAKTPKPKAPVDVLDELPNVFSAPANENPKLKLLEDLGLVPEGASEISSPQARAQTTSNEPRRGRGRPRKAPAAAVEQVVPDAAPAVKAASRMSALGGKLGKVGAMAGAATSRLGPLAKFGLTKVAGPAGAALTARELAYMAAPETAGRFEDELMSRDMTMPARAFPTEMFGNPLSGVMGKLGQGIPQTPGEPAFLSRGIADKVNGALRALDPVARGQRLAELVQRDPQMTETIGKPLNAAINRVGAQGFNQQPPPMQLPKMSGAVDAAARIMGPRSMPLPQGMAAPARPMFRNDALERELAGLGQEPSQVESSMKPPQIGKATAKIDQVKAEAVNPANQKSAVAKIADAKRKPTQGARALLKSSPTRAVAQSMFGGLPKSLQESFANADEQALAALQPKIDAPYASSAPVDFGAEFSKNFTGSGLTQDRLAWLNERPSGLPVQEQVPQRKPNPLLRALSALRRPF